MKKFKLSKKLTLQKTEGKGIGVFATKAIPAGKVIERSPVLVFSPEERKHLEETGLYNYIFEWAEDNKSCIVALGYLSLYNHSYESNCEYIMYFDKNLMVVKTIKPVKAGEELTINYNGDVDSKDELWFEVLED